MSHLKALTTSTKLQAFQYRLLNSAITTNIDLYRWKMRLNEKCTFCDSCPETVTQKLVLCPTVVRKIWIPLKRWLYNFCFITLELDPYEIIFNKYRDSFPDLVNTILTLTKQFIYATRCLNKLLNFLQLMHKVQEHRQIEHIIARKNRNIPKFEAKWSIYTLV